MQITKQDLEALKKENDNRLTQQVIQKAVTKNGI